MRLQILLLSSLILFSCKSTPVIQPMTAENSFSVPIVSEPVQNIVIPESKQEGTDIKPAKIESPSETIIEEVIKVQLPDNKIGTIQVSRKKQTIKQKIKEVLTNTPTHDIKADFKGVSAYQPEKSIWWRWILVILSGLFIISAIAVKIFKFDVLEFIKKIIR